MQNDEKILKILETIVENMATKADVARLETTQQEQGEKLEKQGKAIQHIQTTQQEQGKKIDHLLNTSNHTDTIVEILADKIDEAKAEIDEIKQKQRPLKAD